jgi:hypothetical protein
MTVVDARLREIAFELETPIGKLGGVVALLGELINGTARPPESQVLVYELLERTVALEVSEIHRLWRELFDLVHEVKESVGSRRENHGTK